MSTEFIVYTVINGVIALAGIIGNIIIACISKNINLEMQSKYNKYLPRKVINKKADSWILHVVDGPPYPTIYNYHKRTQKYIFIRYNKIRAKESKIK